WGCTLRGDYQESPLANAGMNAADATRTSRYRPVRQIAKSPISKNPGAKKFQQFSQRFHRRD
ncbi:MAG: hypothetical protein ACI92S_002416, partial [Planctomycetaceae bacterium]